MHPGKENAFCGNPGCEVPPQMSAPSPGQQPTIGRIVLYKLYEEDVHRIKLQRMNNRSFKGSDVEPGEVYPAVVVKVWEGPDVCVNLHVHLNGNDAHWVPQVGNPNGDSGEIAPGTWGWPPRV